MYRFVFPLAVGLILFCSSKAIAQTAGFAAGIKIGQITKESFAELSGMVASRNNPGVLWVHNDRDRDQIHAVSTNGQHLATWSLSEEVDDLEDIAIGPGPLEHSDYLYCGDIGDNAATRGSIRVYRAPEPAVYAYQAAEPPSPKFPMVDKITLEYPDGSHNAESFMVDPLTGDLFIITKQPNRARVYKAERERLQDGARITLTFVVELEFDNASSGDISADGQAILLRQEEFARLWSRPPGQTIADAFQRSPMSVPVIGTPTEPNGEAIAFAPDGQGYFTVSEGAQPAIYFFAKTDISSAKVPRALISPGSTWKYQDDGSNPGTGWSLPEFDDTTWLSGAAQFGYGEDDEQTVIKFGPDKDRKFTTTYFRKQFQVPNPAEIQTLILGLTFDDGVAVYLNGSELFRQNLAANATFCDPALASASAHENVWQKFPVTNRLRAGANTIAVEVHRYSSSEGDLSFDLQLLAIQGDSALQFIAPPRRDAGIGWTLDVQGPSSASVSVEGSENFRDWTRLGTVLLTNGVGRFDIPQAGAPWRFFRLNSRAVN